MNVITATTRCYVRKKRTATERWRWGYDDGVRLHLSMALLVGCGFSAPATMTDVGDAGADAVVVPPDAPGTGTDAPMMVTHCFGPASPSAFEVCLGEAPTGAITLPAMLDTRPGVSDLCLEAQPVGWTPAQPPACFIIANSITVDITTVTGTRPLVLVASSTITINGLLDVSSHADGHTGPAANGSGCNEFPGVPGGSSEGRGGGAGGSFMTVGGDGGEGGEEGEADNGEAPEAMDMPAMLHGGCSGQQGNGTTAGAPGAGGGAVYLVAGSTVTGAGTINASGAGGAAGGGTSRPGGSGGGTGGMVAVHAGATIGVALMANGGGGSGGGNSSVIGSDPDPDAPMAQASGGAGDGTGGRGFGGTMPASVGQSGGDDESGGGGGGGAGWILTNLAPTGLVSPTAVQLP